MARESRKCLLHRCNPKVAPVQVWGCTGARDIFDSPGPSTEKTTCSLCYRFRGNPGIRALYQARGIAIVAQKRPNKLSKADNILQKTQKLRLRPQGGIKPNGTSFFGVKFQKFSNFPGDVPEMSRRCPGDVPELSRRCPGDVPEMSQRRPGDVPNIPHVWPAWFFWNFAYLGGFLLVLVGFPFFCDFLE